jgi:hypothetical protein
MHDVGFNITLLILELRREQHSNGVSVTVRFPQLALLVLLHVKSRWDIRVIEYADPVAPVKGLDRAYS